MKHLLVSREYPPSSYPRGGIGTYVEHIAHLLASRGEMVHVVAELWDGAPTAREVRQDGCLVIHRVPMGEPLDIVRNGAASREAAGVLDAMARTPVPAQSFAWQAALLMEALVEREGIDVIEGQDYEAPLFYFLVRRALGLGPSVLPPCFVHLHTPWEFVCHANGRGLASEYDITLKQFEDYTIGAADALLCPSAFLAAHAERHYGLPSGSVERIPYPIGNTPLISRPPETWQSGTICYFGRFEGRKGVAEWLTAAVALAEVRPNLRFEFIGSDTPLADGSGSTSAALMARVPPALRDAFTFTGSLGREPLLGRLAQARMAVVPSRWENFPNTCVEAMCSGLPVLVSPHGGMAEMVVDGETGWIAASGRPTDLTVALARALDSPPEALAAMGARAAAAIRALCDNERTLERQLEFRRRLVARGAARSVRVPVPADWRPLSPSLTSQVASVEGRRASTPALGTAGAVVHCCAAGVDVSAVLELARSRAGVVLVDEGWEARDDVADISADIFASQPDVGLIVPWSGTDDGVGGVTPHPTLPYQWASTERPPCVAVRAAALSSLEWTREVLDRLPAAADVILPLLAEGWVATTYPAVLVRRADVRGQDDGLEAPYYRSRLRLAILGRYRERLARDAAWLAHLSQTGVAAAQGSGRGAISLETAWRLPIWEQLALVARAVRSPRYALHWLGRQRRSVRPRRQSGWDG